MEDDALGLEQVFKIGGVPEVTFVRPTGWSTLLGYSDNRSGCNPRIRVDIGGYQSGEGSQARRAAALVVAAEALGDRRRSLNSSDFDIALSTPLEFEGTGRIL